MDVVLYYGTKALHTVVQKYSPQDACRHGDRPFTAPAAESNDTGPASVFLWNGVCTS